MRYRRVVTISVIERDENGRLRRLPLTALPPSEVGEANRVAVNAEPVEVRFELGRRVMVAEGLALLFTQDAVVREDERITRVQGYAEPIDAGTGKTRENYVFQLPEYDVHNSLNDASCLRSLAWSRAFARLRSGIRRRAPEIPTRCLA